VPRAEDNLTPRGQEYGAATEQENFIQALPPQPLPPLVEPTTEPPVEPEVANQVPLSVGDVDMNSVLTRPTDRPEEDVRTGLAGSIPTRQSMADVLDGLVRRGFGSPDVNHLLQQARNLGV
jgi:hypothetical protein